MNRNTFPNMGGARPQQSNHHVGGMQRNGGGNSTDIQNHIMTIIAGQPAPPGWQQTVPPKRRATVIHQMVTGLQIVKPDMTLTYAVNVATGFEMQQFTNCATQESYDRAWHAKLEEIRRTRQNQANMHQQQFLNSQQNQMGPTQQQMQAHPMMNNQTPLQRGFGMPQEQQSGQAMGVPMQQQLFQNSRQFPNGNAPAMQLPPQNGQPMQNVPRLGTQSRGQTQFSPQEAHQIQNIAVQIMARMSEQDKMNIRQRLLQVPLEQRQAMQANNMDPVTAWVRTQATQTFIAERQKRRQGAVQGISMPSNGSMKHQVPPSSQIPPGVQQPQPTAIMPPPDSAFGTGNLEQFMGQQRDALRLQAAGQDVVPASNGQGTAAQMRATPHQQPQGQFVPNGMQPPSSFQPQSQAQGQWNGTQNQQSDLPPTTSIPSQTPTPKFANVPGQTAQQQALQGQLGGLNSNRGQRTPQQNHDMPTLNQAMDPPNQVTNERPSQQTPKQGTRNAPNGQPATSKPTQSNAGQQNSQTPSAMQAQWARLPPNIKQQLTNMPEENRKRWIMDMQRRQQQQIQQRKAAAEAQATQNSQQAAQINTQGAALQVSQTNNPPIAPPVSTAGPQQAGTPFGRANVVQPQVPQQQGPLDGNRASLQKGPQIQMTEDQRQKMDNQHFPPAILNRNSSLGQLPESVKTWHQLKEYVRRNAQNLDPKIMNMVNGLQGIHMQQILQEQKRRHQQQLQQQQMNQAAQAHPQSVPGGPAPQAPMIPQQFNHPPTSQPPVSLNAANGFAMPNIPQPTVAEMQHARSVIPDRVKGISDNQLRQMIMHKRHEDALKANQQYRQRFNLLHAQGQQNQLPLGQPQPAQMAQPIDGQAQQLQPVQQHQQPLQLQHGPKQQAQPNGQARQAQSNRPGAQDVPPPSQKGPKRSTSDDVIEVPDPKTAPQQGRPPNVRPPPLNGMPQITPEAYAKMSPEQKIEFGQRMQAQAGPRAKQGLGGQNAPGQAPVPPSQNAAQNNARGGRLNQLIQEVALSTPTRPTIPMSPRTRSQMIDKLKDSTGNMVQRVEQSLPVFLSRIQDETQAKELLRIRLLLLRQVEGPDFSVPVDNFTMTIEELDAFKKYLHKYFAFMLHSLHQAPSSSSTTGQLPPGQPQQLNVANLQQYQAAINAERVATAQKGQANNSHSSINNNNNNNTSNNNSNKNKAPAAPTSSQPPFNLFGATSPQGVPQAYATQNSLTRDQLKLPPGKKRKPNQGAHAASIPARAVDIPANKASPPAKVEPEAPRAPVVPSMMKCAVADCETGKMGFTTKEDLEKHRMEVHEPKEPVIKDPLDAAAYAIESMRIALNLDENGKSKPIAQEQRPGNGVLHAPAVKASATPKGQNHIKQEAATPMSRIPTQTGPSPSSNMLKTPQATANVKTPASEAKSAGKDAATKPSTTAKAQAAATPDPWANSLVKPEWFREVFADVGSLNHPVSAEFITNWMERNPLTPPTSPSSGGLEKDSPNKSDISANDNLNINVANDEDWMWFDDGLPDDMEALDMGGLMDMEWDAAYGLPEEEEKALGKGKRRRDPMEPSDEWLKAYAPEKYEENKKRDAQRKR